MRGWEWAVGGLVGWTLMFGDPRTENVGWKAVDSFDSEGSCQGERLVRAREVRDKTVTDRPLDVVLQFYRCVPSAETADPPTAKKAAPPRRAPTAPGVATTR